MSLHRKITVDIFNYINTVIIFYFKVSCTIIVIFTSSNQWQLVPYIPGWIRNPYEFFCMSWWWSYINTFLFLEFMHCLFLKNFKNNYISNYGSSFIFRWKVGRHQTQIQSFDWLTCQGSTMSDEILWFCCRIIMCMFCGDPYSVENVLGPLISHQCCFLSGDRSIILETFLDDSKRKVEVIVSSFHGANAFREELVHGFILVYSAKRRASLATLK